MTIRQETAEDRRPGRSSILLSAFVYPGLGQFAQRRWVWGALYAGSFTACLVWFAVCSATIIASFYRLGIEFERYEARAVPLRSMVISFLLGLAVFLLNILDAYVGYSRQCKEAARRHAATLGMPEPPDQDSR